MFGLGRRGALMVVGVVTVSLAVGAVPALAQPSHGDGGPQAGPALLYAEPPRAPQLENTGPWHADPIGVCLSSAYRDGEFVYQGCPYDDEGAGNEYRWPVDTLARNYTYPQDPAYRRNAANIIEVRVKPGRDDTLFRVTLNSMTRPDLYGLTLALGDSGKARQAPHQANTVMPADRFVTVHDQQGDIVDAESGKVLEQRPEVKVDPLRRQVEITVPHSAFDPTGRGSVRLGAAAGLWERGTDHYLVPRLTADRDHPGGAIAGDPHPSAFFDVAFRFHEPVEAPYLDNDQRRAIAGGDLTPFHADVDFGKLARGENDNSGVPTRGYLTRIYASHFESAQGRRLPSDPGGPPPGSGTQQGGLQTGSGRGQHGRFSLQFGWPCRDGCVPDLPGRLQRYTVYVPDAPAPEHGYSSLVWTNGYALRPGDDVAGPKDLFRQFAQRPGDPTMVIDVDARGNDEWAYGQSGASIFEALADARRHYHLDADRTAMGGFSSGAYMANKISLTFPDVFHRAFICDGLDVAPSFPGLNGLADVLPIDTLTKHEPGSKLSQLLPSRRNQPVMEWAGANDDFIPYDITRTRGSAYARGHYDYEFVTWAGYGSEHLAMCKNGMWSLATRWFGHDSRQQNPPHVTYVRDPFMDDPGSGLVGDHAYYLSRIEAAPHAIGTIDVVSHGLGVREAAAPANRTQVGAAAGTVLPVNPYLREWRHLPAPVPAEKRNELEVHGTDIRSVTIDPDRAGVGCDTALNVTSNTDLEVTLLGCHRTEHFRGTGGSGLVPYDPADPLNGVRPAKGGPLPAELGNVPQAPLSQLPPLRFPPNQANPRPRAAG